MTKNFVIATGFALFAVSAGVAQAQSVDKGKQVFQQCVACHSIDGGNGAGPTLKGIYGSKAAEVSGFRFSRGMKKATFTWDDQSLDAFIADPQKQVPGNVMPFSGIPDDKDRADLIAYLKTLK